MMKTLLRCLMVSGLFTVCAGAADVPVLIVVVDALRPDYLSATPALMPNLKQLAAEGVECKNHHAVFPTVTRLNSACISTGAYPERNGLMGNSVYFPELDRSRGLSVANAKNLMNIDAATGGKLLTSLTLSEYLDQQGLRFLNCSSGSAGSSYLQNPRILGGGIINCDLVLPKSLRGRVDEVLGPAPADAMPNAGRNRWAVDAYIKLGLDHIRPNATVIWLSDPDHTGHKFGIGSPETNESLRLVDEEIGRIVEAHRTRGLEVNMLVLADHGFTTSGEGMPNLAKLLVKEGLKESADSEDVVVVADGIYVNEGAEETVPRIVRLLQKTKGIGPVFMRAKEAGSMEGQQPGTISFDAIHFNHERAPHILVSAAWSEAANQHGYPGTTTDSGTAGHGSFCPYDVRGTLIAHGPAFKRQCVNTVPTGNVDIAPTVCGLLGLKPAESMQGRVLSEMLAGGPDPESIRVEQKEIAASAELDGVTYRQTLHESVVENRRYLDWARRD